MPLDPGQFNRRQEPAKPLAVLIAVAAYAVAFLLVYWVGSAWYESVTSPGNEFAQVPTPAEYTGTSSALPADSAADISTPSADSAPPPKPANTYAVSNAKILKPCRLHYPARAVREHNEGRTAVRVRIGVDGTAKQAEIHRASSHAELDAAALASARCFTFKPRTVNGEAVESSVIIPFEFKLER